MHVQIEGLWPSGIERDDEAGLLAGLAERGAGEIALVALLGVPAGWSQRFSLRWSTTQTRQRRTR